MLALSCSPCEAMLQLDDSRPKSARLEHLANAHACGGAATWARPSSRGLGLASRLAGADNSVLPPDSPSGTRFVDDQREGTLLEGLRTLVGSSACSGPPRPRSAAKAVPPPLLTSSSICDRANDRNHSLTERIADWERATSQASKKEMILHEDMETREARFLELLASVQGAAHANIEGEGALSRLRLGELIAIELGAQDMRYFTVPLPARVADIAVTITCPSSSQVPAMFLSLTPGLRPTKTSHDIEGDAGDLHFRHEAEPGRSAFVLLVATDSEPYIGRLRCTARRPDDEAQSGGSGAASIRRLIEDRLAHLRQDPAELQHRVQAAKEHREKLTPALRDYARAHRRQIANCEPAHRARGLEQQKERRIERQTAAERRREENEEALVAKAERCLKKEEEWRRRKELEALLYERNVLLPKLWLQRMTVVVFCHSLSAKFREEKVEREDAKRRLRASQLIQKYALKHFCWKRRREMYSAAIAFRVGMVQYARHMRLAACMVAQSRVVWMLQARARGEGRLQVVSVVKSFLIKVKKLQRATRRFLRTREARMQALLRHFTAASAALAHQALDSRRGLASQRLSNLTTMGQAPATAAVGNERRAAAKSSPTGSSKNHTVPGVSGSVEWGSAEHPSTVSSVGMPAFFTAYGQRNDEDEAEDLLPIWLRRMILREHVSEMMKSYAERMKKYMVLKKELDFEMDAQRFVHGNSATVLRCQGMAKAPRTVEVSRMPLLYAQTYDAFVGGDKLFKAAIFNHRRAVRKVFNAWFRIWRGYGAQYGMHKRSYDALGACMLGMAMGTTPPRKVDSDGFLGRKLAEEECGERVGVRVTASHSLDD